MDEKIIIIDNEGLPISVEKGWTSVPKNKKVVKKDSKREQRRLASIERRKQKKVVDITHPWKKQFFQVKNVEVKKSEKLILKKATNGYERGPTKKHE